MVSRPRWAALAISAGIAGCNSLAGIREAVFDPCLEDAGDALCAAGDPGATSSTSTSSSGSAGASTGGAGGSRAICGNGVLDPGEECDDGSTVDGDGCTQCQVDCDEPGAFKVAATAHCYWVSPKALSFFESSVRCQYQGGKLASVTSPLELQQLDPKVSGPLWIGASALAPAGAFHWLDGEPWAYAPWSAGVPDVMDKDLCVLLDGEPLLFGAKECTQARKALCERAPAIGP